MSGIITLPFRTVRAGRFALIGIGAIITGLGLWLQINGIPDSIAPVISTIGKLLSPLIDPQNTVFGLMSKIGGVLGLLGLLGMTMHDIAPARSGEADAEDGPLPVYTPVITLAAKPAQSTWQERLAAKTVTGSPRIPQIKHRRSFADMLRLVLASAVVIAFVAVLAATFFGLPQTTATNTASVALPGRAMIQAHLAGGLQGQQAIAVPQTAATPAAFDFALPDVDPAVVLAWGKDQLARAMTGDQDAMIKLGSIVGAIFALMLILKILFSLGRRKAVRRSQIGQMGYN